MRKHAIESVLLGLSAVVAYAAFAGFLVLFVGCGSNGGSGGDGFDLCTDEEPDCECGTAECVDGQWSCPQTTDDGTCQPECMGDPPECTQSCETDDRASSTCTASGWQCVEGSFPISECTSDCDGDPPSMMCAPGCGGDVLIPPECRDGEWDCPENAVHVDECPDDTCWGLPPSCQTACVEEGEFVSPTCTEDGSFECEDAVFGHTCQDNPCDLQTSSTLPGVSVDIPMDTCTWTIYEVRDGFEIPVEITVENEISVAPAPGPNNCDGPTGLALDPLYEIHGNGQQYCYCDVGLCAEPEQEFVTIEPGTYEFVIDWPGKNWIGPSDFGNEPGDYFPTGEYSVSVTMDGEYSAQDGHAPYDVTADLNFQLVE